MAMQSDTSDQDMMSEINMTPFVDVLLVLLIIFLVTLPLVHHSVNIKLPKVSNQKIAAQPDPIHISIDEGGEYHLNHEPISIHALRHALLSERLREPQPMVHLYADENTRYEPIAKLLAELYQAGLSKIGFVTQAPSRTSSAPLSDALIN